MEHFDEKKGEKQQRTTKAKSFRFQENFKKNESRKKREKQSTENLFFSKISNCIYNLIL